MALYCVAQGDICPGVSAISKGPRYSACPQAWGGEVAFRIWGVDEFGTVRILETLELSGSLEVLKS